MAMKRNVRWEFLAGAGLLVVASFGAANLVAAHSGATGVVKERMELMKVRAMRPRRSPT